MTRITLAVLALLTATAPAQADCLSNGRNHCRPLTAKRFIACVESNNSPNNPYQLKSGYARNLGPDRYVEARYGSWTNAETVWRRRCTYSTLHHRPYGWY